MLKFFKRDHKLNYVRITDLPLYLETDQYYITHDKGVYYIMDKLNNELITTDKIDINIKQLNNKGAINMNNLKNTIENMTNDYLDTLTIYDFNEALRESGYYDDVIHKSNELNELLEGEDPYSILQFNKEDYYSADDFIIVDFTSNIIRSFRTESLAYEYIYTNYKDDVIKDYYNHNITDYIINNIEDHGFELTDHLEQLINDLI